MSEKRKGRPYIFQQNEIENKLRECFIQKMDPKTTAKLTGHDIKTIRKFFKKSSFSTFSKSVSFT